MKKIIISFFTFCIVFFSYNIHLQIVWNLKGSPIVPSTGMNTDLGAILVLCYLVLMCSIGLIATTFIDTKKRN